MRKLGLDFSRLYPSVFEQLEEAGEE